MIKGVEYGPAQIHLHESPEMNRGDSSSKSLLLPGSLQIHKLSPLALRGKPGPEGRQCSVQLSISVEGRE